MKTKLLFVLLLVALSFVLLCALARSFNTEQERDQYGSWLDEEVPYIISDKERELYESLKVTAERERFIEAFWEIRDPTPGTQTNEYKEEIRRRYEYADLTFGERGLPGWRAAMGEVHILLGKPLEVRQFDSTSLTAPAIAWLYPPYKSYGIKYYFYVLFYKRTLSSPYQIYLPTKDDPAALLGSADVSDEQALSRLLKIDPLLAQLSLSLLPEEHRPLMIDNPAELRRALDRRTSAGEQVIKAVLESRNYRQSENASKLLKILRGSSEFTGSTTYKESSFTGTYQFHVIRDEAGQPALYYVFVADSSMITLSEFPGRCCALLQVHAKARDESGSLVEDSLKYISANFSPHEVSRQGGAALTYEGQMRLPAGSNVVTLTLRNPIDRRYFVIEEIVEIPRYPESQMKFCAALLLRDLHESDQDDVSEERRYQFYGIECQPNVDGVLAQGEQARVFYQLYFPRRDRVSSVRVRYWLESQGRTIWRGVDSLSHASLGRGAVFNQTVVLPSEKLPPDSYSFHLAAASLTPPEARTSIDFIVVPESKKMPVPKLARTTR